MKKIFISIFLLGTFGCTDLDLKPADGNVAEVVFTDAAAYKSYLAKVYGAFFLTGQQGPAGRPDITIVSDEGFTSYNRSYWKVQELTTDEAVIGWQDAGIRDLHNLSWSSENQFVRVLYYRIFYIIAYSNDFLGQASDAKLGENGISSADQDIIRGFRSEARFLRALAYWHALDLFRNVPLVTAITADLPTQATPQQLFDFIESELLAIESELPDPMQNEYGRADKAAVWTLLAKLYLNAESMGVALSDSRNAYTECAVQCQKVMDAGYQLATVYKNLFLADNHKEATTELIFTFPADGVDSKTWGSTTFLVHGALGEKMVDQKKDTDNTTEYKTEDIDLYGVSAGWAGMRTTSAMVAKFSGATIPIAQDPRAMFYTNGQSLEITDIGKFAHGYAVPKFKNLTSDGKKGSSATFCDTDYPVFRLADVYLMYVEALERGGTAGTAVPLTLINALRDRAYGPGVGNVADAAITLDFILDERTRELYWEGTRRTDLIRFGKFLNGVWPMKGGVEDGTFVADDHLLILPIPASDMVANPKLKQNDGY